MVKEVNLGHYIEYDVLGGLNESEMFRATHLKCRVVLRKMDAK
jgi:hypothetical protein